MSPAEEEAFPLTDTQIADNAVKTLEGFKASGAAKPFFVACGFRETGPTRTPLRSPLPPSDSVSLHLLWRMSRG